MHLSSGRRGDDFLIRSAKPAVTNVVLDVCIEQDAILRDDTDGFPQTGLSNIPDILTVNQDSPLTFLEIVESVQESENSGLSRAGATNESDR